jgi:hypothetical protein
LKFEFRGPSAAAVFRVLKVRMALRFGGVVVRFRLSFVTFGLRRDDEKKPLTVGILQHIWLLTDGGTVLCLLSFASSTIGNPVAPLENGGRSRVSAL